MNSGPIVRLLSPAVLAALLLLALRVSARGDDERASVTLAARHRQPVALLCADGGNTLLVANRKSGSITVIDTAARRVIAEHDVGRSLIDLVILPDGQRLLTVDGTSNELVLLDYRDRSIRVTGRIKVSPDPVRLAIAADGSTCVVASRWSRRLNFVGLPGPGASGENRALTHFGSLDLPFSPRELATFSDGSRLVVADAFGGRLAVVDVKRRLIESVRALPAHNIRGLAFAPDGQTLVIAHQVQNRLAQTRFDDVHWGLLVRNHLRVVRTSTLLSPGPDTHLLERSRLFDLGDVGYAAGDPSALAFDARGNLIVALAGVDEIAITPGPEQSPRRIAVGRQPSALATSPDGSRVYVADTLDDAVSVLEIKSGTCIATIPLGPRLEPSAADRGERLFSSAKLSHDGWMSCQSCHTDGHTNNLSSDTLGDGSFGAPKRVPSLLGVGTTGPWTWTGSVDRLEDQIRKSITTTMQGPRPAESQVADLKAYLHSLVPPPLASTDAVSGDSPAVARGREVFHARKCAACHVPPEFTSPGRYDVGLADELGVHEFNPPSLRAVSRRDALFHDGRASTLEHVFDVERHPRGLELSAREVVDLVAFLKTL